MCQVNDVSSPQSVRSTPLYVRVHVRLKSRRTVRLRLELLLTVHVGPNGALSIRDARGVNALEDGSSANRYALSVESAKDKELKVAVDEKRPLKKRSAAFGGMVVERHVPEGMISTPAKGNDTSNGDSGSAFNLRIIVPVCVAVSALVAITFCVVRRAQKKREAEKRDNARLTQNTENTSEDARASGLSLAHLGGAAKYLPIAPGISDSAQKVIPVNA